MTADFTRERQLRRVGVWPVAGVDEVGRGPLAGPVCAAAVILDPARLPAGVDDSKRLTAKERVALFTIVAERALAIGIGFACPAEIDAINIRRASLAAMRRAVAALAITPVHALIDGTEVPADLVCAGEAMVKGDGRSASIAAASIVAKVTRDRLMHRLAAAHPGYGFERHVGYATATHLAALREHGACPHHRRSVAPVRAALAPAGLSEKNTGASGGV